MRTLTAPFAALFTFATLLLAGCGPEYPACDTDGDCREGEFCVNGQCQDCRTDGDCETGQQCRSGACEDIPGYCDAATPCPAGQECVNNRCQTIRVTECDDARPCPTGQQCSGGDCVPIPGYCDASTPCPAGQRCEGDRCVNLCSFDSVYFEFDSHALDSADRDVLSRDRACTTERGSSSLTLTGHADPRGTEEYNMALSESRARAVQQYLRRLGVHIEMRPVGRGEESASGYDEASWERDRRVDIE